MPPSLPHTSPEIDAVVACPGCDLLQRLPTIPPKARARCPRCGEVVATTPADPIERPLALTLAAAITLIVANAMPLMTLSVVGRFAETTILGGAEVMWKQGQPITATLVAFCTAVAPTTYLALMCTLLVAARRAPTPAWVGPLLRLAEHAKAWSLPEVMLLGILVALVKIADLATVEPGIGLFATGVLLVLLASLAVQFDPETIWHRITWVDPVASHHRGKGIAAPTDEDPDP